VNIQPIICSFHWGALREGILPEDDYKTLVNGELAWDGIGAAGERWGKRRGVSRRGSIDGCHAV
jgi:hypothetical protein